MNQNEIEQKWGYLWSGEDLTNMKELHEDIILFGQHRFAEGVQTASNLQGKEIQNYRVITKTDGSTGDKPDIKYCERQLFPHTIISYRVGCCKETLIDINNNFKFCPYCGKQIKEVE